MEYSENTLKRYRIALKKLEEANLSIKEEPEKVVMYLQEKYDKYNTRKSFLSAIYSTYEDRTTIPKVYKDAMGAEFKLQKAKEEAQELTPEQDANYLPWNEIMKVQKTLENKKDKTKSEWLEYLVVSLYTLTSPVRSDYGAMKIVKSGKDKSKLNLFVNIKQPYFLFREYKTADTYGNVKILVPKPLVKVITEWFEYINQIPEYLLGENKYTPITLSNYVRNVFKKYTDKSVGINILRHSYLTYMNDVGKLRSIKNKTAVAKKMLHSIETQTKYDLPKKGVANVEADAKSQD
jgi:hypothetical protein